MSYTILLVEDYDSFSSYLNKRLTQMGYTVILAENGEEAVQKTEEHIPDLILMDLKLPVMDGIEACKKIKNNKLTKHIPLIFISAKHQEGEIKEGYAAGGDNYLVKPILFPVLMEEINKWEERAKNKLQANG